MVRGLFFAELSPPHNISRSLEPRNDSEPFDARRILPLPRILLQPLPRRGAKLQYVQLLVEQYRLPRRASRAVAGSGVVMESAPHPAKPADTPGVRLLPLFLRNF